MNDDDDNIVSIEINRRTALLSRTMEIEMCSIHTPHTPHTRSTFQSDSEWFGTFGVEIMKTHVAKLSPSIVEYRWRKKTISSMTMANIVSHFKHSFFLYFFICFHPIFDIFSINFFFAEFFAFNTRIIPPKMYLFFDNLKRFKANIFGIGAKTDLSSVHITHNRTQAQWLGWVERALEEGR